MLNELECIKPIRQELGTWYFKHAKYKKDLKHLKYLYSKVQRNPERIARMDVVDQGLVMSIHDLEVDIATCRYNIDRLQGILRNRLPTRLPIDYKVKKYLENVSIAYLLVSHPKNFINNHTGFYTTEKRKEQFESFRKRDLYIEFVSEWKILHDQDEKYKLTQEEKNNLFVDIQGFHYVMISQQAKENQKVATLHLADDNGQSIIPMYTVYKNIRDTNVLINNYNEFFRTSKHGIPIFHRKTHEYVNI